MLPESPGDGQTSRGGRRTPLYRQRCAHLRLLAGLLEKIGHDPVVTEPAGMPVLELRRYGISHADVIATVGYGDVDWYRWVSGDYLVPCSEPLTAARQVVRALRPGGKTRVS